MQKKTVVRHLLKVA
jgi:hypothetical protein